MKRKSSWRTAGAGQTQKARQAVLFAALGMMGLAGAGHAQQVFAPPPPPVSLTPPSVAAEGPGEMQVFPPNSALADILDELHPLQWGPVALHPHVAYRFVYGTGIQSSPTNQSSTIIQTFAPGVLFVMGTHWTLDYTPTFTFYSDKNFQNNVGQSVTLTGATTFEDWAFGLSQNFTYTSSPQVQTGTQTDQQTYTTSITASRPLNSVMSVDLGVNQSFDFPTGFESSKQWSTLDWLNYQFWPRLVAGVGAGLGFTVTTPDRLFEQLQGRVNWRATDKISFGLNGGAEFSQFTDGGASPVISPIFGGAIEYQPFEHTQISFNATRSVSTSFFENQITEVTSLTGGVNQRLFQKFYLNVTGGYNWTSYTSSAAGASANRPSDYYSINVQLSASILKRGSVAVFYNYSQNLTDQPGLAYSSNQVGFNLGYAF